MSGSPTSVVAFFLARRSLLRSNRGILLATIAMLVLVYLNMVFLPSLIEGASKHVVQRLVETTTGNLAISPADRQTGIAGVSSYEKKVEREPGVAGVATIKLVGKDVYHGSSGGSWSVYATEPTAYDSVFTTDRSLTAGRWLRHSETDGIVLGASIVGDGQHKLSKLKSALSGVSVGDAVEVALANGKAHQFRVVGIFDDEFRSADANAYITEAAAAKLLPGSQDHADEVFVKTKPRASLAKVRREITPLSSKVSVESSAELEEPIHEQLGSDKLISDILKIVAAIVAAITIFMVTYVDLVNRRRQIGIERAIGIRTSAIVAGYCIKATVYAILGIALGVVLFRFAVVPLVAAHPFHFPNGPVTLSPSAREMIRDGVLLALVAVLAAFVPAYRSVRIKILDAIWG